MLLVRGSWYWEVDGNPLCYLPYFSDFSPFPLFLVLCLSSGFLSCGYHEVCVKCLIHTLGPFSPQLFSTSKSILKERVCLKGTAVRPWWRGCQGLALRPAWPSAPVSASCSDHSWCLHLGALPVRPAGAGASCQGEAWAPTPCQYPLSSKSHAWWAQPPLGQAGALFPHSACFVLSWTRHLEVSCSPGQRGSWSADTNTLISLPGELEKGSRAVGTMGLFINCSEIQSLER